MPEPGNVIQVNIRDLRQLFNSMDPSPFHEKDLDADAEEFIVSWAHEFPAGEALSLVIHLETGESSPHEEQLVRDAVHNFFAYRARLKRRELRELLNRGRTSLIIGLLFLAGCMGAANFVAGVATQPPILVVQESMLIAGWVAMWRPMEIFLYDWWPIRRLCRMFEMMARMDVTVRHAPR